VVRAGTQAVIWPAEAAPVAPDAESPARGGYFAGAEVIVGRIWIVNGEPKVGSGLR